jgi:hypothetical protein
MPAEARDFFLFIDHSNCGLPSRLCKWHQVVKRMGHETNYSLPSRTPKLRACGALPHLPNTSP